MAIELESRDNPELQVQAALRDCYDPTLPCNIVDLGLIHAIALTPDPEAPGAQIPGVPRKFRATITLTPTTQDEAATAQLSAQIANRLAGLEQIIHTEVRLLDHPARTPLQITPAGRRTTQPRRATLTSSRSVASHDESYPASNPPQSPPQNPLHPNAPATSSSSPPLPSIPLTSLMGSTPAGWFLPPTSSLVTPTTSMSPPTTA